MVESLVSVAVVALALVHWSLAVPSAPALNTPAYMNESAPHAPVVLTPIVISVLHRAFAYQLPV